jgi:hypothetical protein
MGLILVMILLTSDRRAMGERSNWPLVRILGWVTLVVMSAATVGMLFSWLRPQTPEIVAPQTGLRGRDGSPVRASSRQFLQSRRRSAQVVHTAGA